MKISIIIPSYNYAHFIEHALESVFMQNDPNFQAIIIDDGSTDNTEAVVKPFLTQYPNNLRYIRQTNRGAAAARNFGIQEATGEYLLFLDADDRLEPQALAAFREALAKLPQTDMICGGHASIEPSGKRKEYYFTNPLSLNKHENFVGNLHKKFSLVNGACLIHKRVFEKVSYAENLRIAEDINVFFQILALFTCASISNIVVAIYKHPKSLRNQIEYNKAEGITVADQIFNPAILPAEYMQYYQEYYGLRLLSLFRSCYLAKQYTEAKQYYWQAIKAYPKHLFKLAYLKKYLKALLTSSQKK